MSQHDYNIANAAGATVRADINSVLSAIVSQNSGASEPATTFAYEWWADTSNSVLKIRNSGNTGWVTLPFSISADNTVDINAGTVNGISSLSFASGSTVTSILDEDNLSSDSSTALATQQSIKAYVDSQVTAQDLDFQADSGGVLSIDLDSEVFTVNGGTGIDTAGAENTVTINIDSTVATLTGNQTLTNKTIDLDSNTLSNIEVDNLKSGVLDTDLSSVSASDNTLASAKAIKSFVESAITAEDLDISDGSNSIAIDLDSEVLSLLGGTGVTSAASGNGVTFSIGQSVATSDDVTFNSVAAALTGNVTGQVSDISNHSTSALSEGSNLYYTDARFDTRLSSKDTSDLSEGSNLYFTNERVDDRVAALIQNGTGLTWTYDDTAGTFTGVVSLTPFNTSQLTENTNLYYTQARFDSAFSAKTTNDLTENTNLYYTQARFDSAFSAKTTNDLTENTNLYYTDTRANAAIDARVNKAFVDALNVEAASVAANSVALGTDTTGNYVQSITGTANKVSVSGSGSESAAVTLSLPDDVQIANDLTVAGDLTVNGDLTYLDTTNLKIEDNLFELNSNLTGSPVNDSGMLINRGSSNNAVFIWDESADKFTLGLTTADGSATGNITLASLGILVATIEGNLTGNVTGTVSSIANHDTDSLSEGSSNQYFTTARARSSISASGDISYNSSTGVISFTQSASPVTSVNSETGAVVLDTGDISESGNLYYTDARARAAISENSTQLSYDSSTGVLTYTQGNSDTVSEGSSNLFYTDTRVATKVDSYVDKAFIDALNVVAASASGNAGSATVLASARNISGVSFDGSQDITLNTSAITENTNLYYTDTRVATKIDSYVNKAFIDALNVVAASATGNAGSATVLANARTINGVSFNGSADITTHTAGTGVSISGTEISIGQAVGTSDSPTFANMTLSGTGSIKVPSGTTGQRDGSPANGMFRYNTTDAQFEGYADGAWGAIAGSGGGASAMETNNFTGDGSTTAFTLSSSVSDEDNLLAFIEGVYQNKADFVASGTTITFDTAPASGRNIVVHHVKSSISGSNVILNSFTGDGSDTTFTLSTAPQSENNTQVYLNGVYQNKTTYSVSGTTLTFDAAPANSVAIEVMMFTQTAINEVGDATVTTAKLVDDAVTQAKIADDAVGADQLASSAVVTASIVDDAITQAKIADNAVGVDQLKFSATGGTITTAGGYTIHTFTSSGTFTASKAGTVEYLVIAGGGGGGSTVGGGGGAGGYRTATGFSVAEGAHTVTVGAGGAQDTSGSDSVFSTITSTGGGRGGPFQTSGFAGGSGGGVGGRNSSTNGAGGGAGTAGQGNAGGNRGGGGANALCGGGGGGGAGSVGGDSRALDGTNYKEGGHGGDGLASSITGSEVGRGGGGGGGGDISAGGGDASSGGGANGSAGTANKGGGGGGEGGGNSAQAGGSGVVIIKEAAGNTVASGVWNMEAIYNNVKAGTWV